MGNYHGALAQTPRTPRCVYSLKNFSLEHDNNPHLDISNPHALKEVASYLPDVPSGADRVCSNDVFRDPRGLVYVIDRVRGLSIVERL